MSKYLDRLHSLDGQKKGHISNPQNPQKPFEGFEGSEGGRFPGSSPPFEPFEGGAITAQGRSTNKPGYEPLRLQDEANRRNAAALRNGLTDRFCRCGHLAEFAWLDDDGRDVWICGKCLPTRARA